MEPHADPARDHSALGAPEPDPRDPDDEDVERLDPDAPGRWLFDEDEDAPEPNEPG